MDRKQMKQPKSDYSESLNCMIERFGKLITENKKPKTVDPDHPRFNEHWIDVGEYEYLD